jgi:ELWxxDGT repeat protein
MSRVQSRPAPVADRLEPRRLLAARPTAGSDASNLLDVGGTLYFRASDADHGFELWKSDGTAADTVLVKDLLPGPAGSNPVNFTAVGDTLYFLASDAANHPQLWRSDGTEAGTTLVRDLTELSAVTQTEAAVVVGSTVYVAAHDGDDHSALIKSDGTAQGTELVNEFTGTHVQDLIAVASTLYLSAPDPTHGRELWKSDGSAAGTVLVKDINPGTEPSNPFNFLGNVAVLNDVLYFPARGTAGLELWRTDGTEAGTVLVKDINPSGDARPSGLTVIDGAVHFSADDGTTGREWWRTSGSAATTERVLDINPGPLDSNAGGFIKLGDSILFSATDPSSIGELWKSDGTAAGTALLKDINPGRTGSTPRDFTLFNGAVYFFANDGRDAGDHGTELWKTDGTAAGTTLVKDINPGSESAVLGTSPEVTIVNDTMFFRAEDGMFGQELWRSDGTEDETTLVRDIMLEDPPFPFTLYSIESRIWQVLGSERDDRISVTFADDRFSATRNGRSESIDAVEVALVQVAGNGGNDRIIVSTPPPHLVSISGLSFWHAALRISSRVMKTYERWKS